MIKYMQHADGARYHKVYIPELKLKVASIDQTCRVLSSILVSHLWVELESEAAESAK